MTDPTPACPRRHVRRAWWLLALPLLATDVHAATCDPQADDVTAAGGPACAQAWMDGQLKLNDLLAVGTHNSYKQAIPPAEHALLQHLDPQGAATLDYAHKPLQAQLDTGARQLELDVVRDDPQGGRYLHPLAATAAGSALDPDWSRVMAQPGLKALHMPDVDFRSSCPLFRDCLRQLLAWSQRHPRHPPILVLVNAKDGEGVPGGVALPVFDEAGFDELDAEIRSVLPTAHLITPDDVQGNHATLREAVLANAWPTLEQARGRFLFALDENPRKVALYRGARTSLQGRVMFVNTDEGSPAAGYLTLNDPVADAARIAAAVRAGFLVRTRADADTRQARDNDIAHRERALASGAQWISTDYLWPDTRFPGGFTVRLPQRVAVACNPLRTGTRCAGNPVETVADADWARAEAAVLDAPAPRAANAAASMPPDIPLENTSPQARRCDPEHATGCRPCDPVATASSLPR